MIIDNLDNINFYKGLSKHIDTALDFLINTENLETIAAGKHEIDGENVFALVFDYDTHDEFEDKWEAHRTYFDLQYIVSGQEKIAISHIDDMETVTDYHDEGDYQLFKGNGPKITLKKNDFIILAPKDVHQPGIHELTTPGKVRKIVLKALI